MSPRDDIRPLAARLREDSPLLGVILPMPSEALIELAGLTGVDVVLLDAEHGPADPLSIGRHLAAAHSVGLQCLVRVDDLGRVLGVLDQGAAGVVFPQVSTADEARALVAAAHYPPLGRRGFASYTRAGGYETVPVAEQLAAARDTVVVAMIEDAEGVANAAEIAAVEGIDALFVGPADLSIALGYPGEPGHPQVRAAVDAVHVAARSGGRAVVAIAGNTDGLAGLVAAADGNARPTADLAIWNVQAGITALFRSTVGAVGEACVRPS